MFSFSLDKLPRSKLLPIVQSIPFYSSVATADENQFKVLIQHSRLFLAKPGETVIRKGDFDAWCYYVLKGHLEVLSPENDQTVVAQISSGDLFGALAMLNDMERNATVKVADGQQSLLLGLDFAPFGDLEDFEDITLETKIFYYHEVYSRIRMRIEQYIEQYPGNPVAEHNNINECYAGEKHGMDELNYYYNRCIELTEWLTLWNKALTQENATQAAKDVFGEDLVADIENFLGLQKSD